MPEPLSPVELRVLGSLAEKEATVPDTYPMTRKGLTTACNQKNNREPVTDLSESEVQAALDSCKARGLVRFVHASHGARTTKYRHVLHEQLDLDPAELAVLTVLALRGPNTLAELRSRTERAHPFDSLEEVESVLAGLAAREDPLVVHLPRRTGERETRWMHRLAGDPLDHPLVATDEADGAPGAWNPLPEGPPPTVEPGRAGLEARVAELEDRVAALEALLADLTG